MAEGQARVALDQQMGRTGYAADAYATYLAEQAILLANRQQLDDTVSIGEAYYLLAWSQVQQGLSPDRDTLDAILANSRLDNPRHIRWRQAPHPCSLCHLL